MTVKSVGVAAAVAASLLVVAAGAVEAQVDPRDVPIVTQPQQRFDSGQDIQPIFEGWTRNEDGSFLLHFGYLNRNYREEPSIPIGPENYFAPGSEDRGQPTYFYPRTQRYQFTVHVPADMGRSSEDGLVWTVVRRGSEQRAVGWLQPEWEIDANTITSNNRTGFGRPKDQVYANRAPEVTASASTDTARVGEAVTLTASITDDELPTRLPPRRPRSRLPALTPPEGTPRAPTTSAGTASRLRRATGSGSCGSSIAAGRCGPRAVRVPAVLRGSATGRGGGRPRDPDGPVRPRGDAHGRDGWTSASFEASVTFDEPGTYTLRAWASDGMLLTPHDVTITVE